MTQFDKRLMFLITKVWTPIWVPVELRWLSTHGCELTGGIRVIVILAFLVLEALFLATQSTTLCDKRLTKFLIKLRCGKPMECLWITLHMWWIGRWNRSSGRTKSASMWTRRRLNMSLPHWQRGSEFVGWDLSHQELKPLLLLCKFEETIIWIDLYPGVPLSHQEVQERSLVLGKLVHLLGGQQELAYMQALWR